MLVSKKKQTNWLHSIVDFSFYSNQFCRGADSFKPFFSLFIFELNVFIPVKSIDLRVRRAKYNYD